MTVCTRFAPSPTGYLHVGGARTALFAWLYARHHGGKFILRIEDTDVARSTEAHIQAIFDGMAWLGLNHDEGPYYQTHRMKRYQEVVNRLLKEGKAYKCYCSKERLSQLREKQLVNKQKPRYDNHCRSLKGQRDGEPFVIRFCTPDVGVVRFEDQVAGSIEFQNSELDDLVIVRSDGVPTYNLSVVVDDLDMGVTHVIRGTDHINNTPRQINIIRALGAKPPIYAHVPMILGSDGKKLSKRHGADNVMKYREDGILPHALLNYLVRLGWSYGDQEIFSIKEMIKVFNLESLSNSAAIFNMEKLLWLNQYYLKSDKPEEVAKELKWHFDCMKIDISAGPNLVEVVKAQVERCKTLKEMAEKSRYFYEDVKMYDQKAIEKNFSPETQTVFEKLIGQFSCLEKWEKEEIHQVILKVAENMNLKLGQVAQPIRIAATGGTISPPIDITLQLLGQKNTVQRLANLLHHISAEKG